LPQLVSAACARSMIQHKTPGSIIFLGSIAGVSVLHPQQQCAYNASKAGVIHLCKSLAAEWAPHGIRCNTIGPGYMDTELNNEANLEGVKQHWCAVFLSLAFVYYLAVFDAWIYVLTRRDGQVCNDADGEAG